MQFSTREQTQKIIILYKSKQILVALIFFFFLTKINLMLDTTYALSAVCQQVLISLAIADTIITHAVSSNVKLKTAKRKLRFTLNDCELYKHKDVCLFVQCASPGVLISAVQYHSHCHQVIIYTFQGPNSHMWWVAPVLNRSKREQTESSIGLCGDVQLNTCQMNIRWDWHFDFMLSDILKITSL